MCRTRGVHGIPGAPRKARSPCPRFSCSWRQLLATTSDPAGSWICSGDGEPLSLSSTPRKRCVSCACSSSGTFSMLPRNCLCTLGDETPGADPKQEMTLSPGGFQTPLPRPGAGGRPVGGMTPQTRIFGLWRCSWELQPPDKLADPPCWGGSPQEAAPRHVRILRLPAAPWEPPPTTSGSWHTLSPASLQLLSREVEMPQAEAGVSLNGHQV